MKKYLLLMLMMSLIINVFAGQLNEGFEGAQFPPEGWSLHNGGDANTWFRSTANGPRGTAHAQISYSYAAHDDWLITPKLVPTAENYMLRFWAKNIDSSYIDKFNVWLSTTTNVPASFTVNLASEVGPPTTYTQYEYDLSGYIGMPVYVAVQAISAYEYFLYVDDFTGPNLWVPEYGVLTVNPDPIAFGSSYIGATERINVSMINTGGAAFNVESIALADVTHFQLEDLPENTITINPDDPAVTFTVVFNPTVAGYLSTQLLIGDTRTSFEVTGTGVEPLSGDICEAPYLVTLPLVDYLGTTAGLENDYTSGMFSDLTIDTGYLRGLDWVAKISIAQLGMLNISLADQTGYSGQWMGIVLVNSIPSLASPAPVLGQAAGLSTPLNITDISVFPGEYYLIVDNWPTPAAVYFKLNINFTPATDPPAPINMVSPIDGALDQSITPTFTWTNGGGSVEKYFVSYGKVNPFSTIVDDYDNELLTTYTPAALEYETEYWWKVRPWNSVGGSPDAIEIEEWNFTTMDDPNFFLSTSNPYLMDFEEITAADILPRHWTKSGSTWTTAVGSQGTGREPRSGRKYATCAWGATTTDWLFTRPFYLEAGKYYNFGIWYRTDGGSGWNSFKMYIGSTAAGAGMTEVLAAVTSPTNTIYAELNKIGWQAPATGSYYIGFQVLASSSPWYMSFDDFYAIEQSEDPVFVIFPTSHNFGTQKVLTNTDQTFTISNIGAGTLRVDQIDIDGDDCFDFVSPPELPIELTQENPTADFTVRYRPEQPGDFSAVINIVDNLPARAPHTVELEGKAYDLITPLPFEENFNASTSLPQYWTQSTSTWSIASSHGRIGNGIYRNLYVSYPTAWFVTRPIGPITASTKLSFFYRWADFILYGYPTTAFSPQDGDNIKIYVSLDEGISFDLCGQIDNSNHTPSMDWIEKVVWLSPAQASAGDRIVLKFEANHSSGDWYIDIDDIKVFDAPNNPVFVITPTSHNFQNVQIGTTDYTVFEISNNGLNPLIIEDGGISISGLDAAAFDFELPDETTYPISITNTPLVVNVSFSPTEVRDYTAELVIVDNMAKASHEIPLEGVGYDSVIRNFPYVQDFEGATFPPQGWSVVNADGGGSTWINSTSLNHTQGGSKSAYHNYAQGDQDGWLITPPIALPASGKYQMSFWDYTQYPGDMEYHGVLLNTVSTVPDDGWDELWSPDTVIQSWNPHEIDLAAYAGQIVFLAFNYQGDFADAWYVDDIRIEAYYDVNDDDNEFVIDPPTNTSVSITGGDANVDTNIDEESLPPWKNTGFTPDAAFRLELFGTGPWTLTFHTDALWIAYYYNGDWHALDASSGTVTFTIDSAKGDVDIDVIAGDKNPTLPVTLSSFTATVNADMAVTIAWVAESEVNHSGYNVLRGEENDLSISVRINSDLVTDGSALGTQISYIYTDLEANMNIVYYYWLESVALDGTVQYAGPVIVTLGDPTQPVLPPAVEIATKLMDAYPNPFNPNTNIRYSLKKPGQVDVSIYNLKGQLIRKFSNHYDSPGYYQIAWDGKDAQGRHVSSGIYLYRMQTANYSQTKKMILAK